MTMPFAALARARARMREGGMEGEQENYRRAQIQREADARDQETAFRRWAAEQQLKRQQDATDYARGRDTIEDQRYADTQKRQAEGAQVDAVRQGFEAAPESTAAQLLAGMSMLQGGTGAAAGMVRAPRTTPFQQKVAGVDVQAEDMGGPQYATVGGRVMRLDRQRTANAAARDDATRIASQDQMANRADARAESRDARMMARQLAAASLANQRQATKAPTAEQEKNFVYYGLMKDAGSQMDALLANKKIDPDKVSGYLTSRIFKPTLNAEEQQFIRSAKDFAAGVLRKESGAAVTPDELRQVFDRYIDAGLDAPETRAAKRDARNAYIQRMGQISQGASDYYQGARPPLSAYPGLKP